jgi:ribosome maturation factor RimP
VAGNRESIIERVTAIAERVGASEGIEVVNVEFVGGGRNRVLRLFIDRFPPGGAPVPLESPSGATLEDCELMSHQVGTILDVEDVIPGENYKLEVSSPGIERKLFKMIDFQRFTGHQAKVTLKPPPDGGAQTHLMGVLKGVTGDVIQIEAGGKTVDFPYEQVLKASLMFRW